MGIGLPVARRVALGSWSDDPTAESRGAQPMPMRYTSDKELSPEEHMRARGGGAARGVPSASRSYLGLFR